VAIAAVALLALVAAGVILVRDRAGRTVAVVQTNPTGTASVTPPPGGSVVVLPPTATLPSTGPARRPGGGIRPDAWVRVKDDTRGAVDEGGTLTRPVDRGSRGRVLRLWPEKNRCLVRFGDAGSFELWLPTDLVELE
jgi:hypothetical protein